MSSGVAAQSCKSYYDTHSSFYRAMDLEMAYTFNSRERTLADWKDLFREADPRFIFKSAIEPKGSAMGILEFEWDGTDGSAT